MDHCEGVVDCERGERQEACLSSKVRTEERGRESQTHLQKLVIHPLIPLPGVGNQRYGMHFMTVDAEEAFSVRNAAWRLLPKTISTRSFD